MQTVDDAQTQVEQEATGVDDVAVASADDDVVRRTGTTLMSSMVLSLRSTFQLINSLLTVKDIAAISVTDNTALSGSVKNKAQITAVIWALFMA